MNKTDHIAARGVATDAAAIGIDGGDHRRTVGIMDILALVWQRKLIVVGFVLAAIGLTFAHLSRVTPIYTATATLVLERQGDTIAGLDLVATGLSTDFLTVNTQTEVIVARVLLHRVAEQMNLADDPDFNPFLAAEIAAAEGAGGSLLDWRQWPLVRDLLPAETDAGPVREPSEAEIREAVVDALATSVSAENVLNSMVFAVNAYSPDPVKAAAIANAVAEAYIEDQLDAKLEVTRRATEWLSVRSEELRARLEESEERVEMARRSSQLINETALQAENRQLKDLRQRASELERDLRTRDLQLEALRSLSRTGGTTLPDAVTVSPQLVQISRQLATATGEREAVLREQFTMQLERDIATAEAQRRLIEEQRALVESSTAEMESEISRKSAELIALRQLERESEANRAVYEFFLTRMNETSAQAGIQRPDARMLSHAVAPTAPTTPRVMRAYAIAIFLAMILGSTVIVARDRMQTSFRSPREFEKAIGKRVLAMIPEAPTSGRRKLFDFMLANRGSNFAEAIRNLRTSILLSWIDQPKQVVMVTSSTPAEGKTTVSLSLAVDFARTGKKVLLVECDIRRRVFSQYMKTDEAKGVVAVLAGTATLEEALVHNAEGGVDVLPAERQNVQAVDLFTSQRFSHFIDEMRQRYDLIVLDTPPVLAVSDPRIIARNADAIIYAVRWGVTPAATVQDGAGQFAGDDMANIGFVMTRVNMKKVMQYSYGGRYSYQSYRAIDRYYTS